MPRGRGARRLTPPRNPGTVSGTSRPPHRGLPGAGCRHPAPLPPRGPWLLSAEGPPPPRSTATSRFTTDATTSRAPPPLPPAPSSHSDGRNQSWRRNSRISRQTCPMSVASPLAPPTEPGFRAKCKDLEEASGFCLCACVVWFCLQQFGFGNRFAGRICALVVFQMFFISFHRY